MTVMKDEKEGLERWRRNEGEPRLPEKRSKGAPEKNLNALKHGIFADRILNEDEKEIFNGIIERLCTDFVFNRSSDFIQVELIGIYSVKLMRAQQAGDIDAAEKIDRMIRCHMKDLKTTKIAREGEEPKAPQTSPAEWASALIEKVSGKKVALKQLEGRKNTERISDNTEDAEYEEADSQGVEEGVE
jgi:uncharacterized protein YjcR